MSTPTNGDRISELERQVKELQGLVRSQAQRPQSMAGLAKRLERVKLTEEPGEDCEHPDGAKAKLLNQADEETEKVIRVHQACGYQKDAKLTVWWRQLPAERDGKWVPVIPGLALPYVLTPCEGSASVRYVWSDELKDAVDKVVKIDGSDDCWTVTRMSELACEDPQARAAAMAQAEEATGVTIYDDCDVCAACWELTPCGGGTPIYANNDLAEAEGKAAKIGSTCYEVERAESCADAELQEVVDTYEDCTHCGKCYELSACWGEGSLTLDNNLLQVALDAIAARQANCEVTDTDADGVEDPLPEDGDDLVGKVFEIGGICYAVDAWTSSCGSSTHHDGEILYHDDCTGCGCFLLTECDPADPENPATVLAHSATLVANSDGVSLRTLLNGDPDADPPVEPTPFVRLDDGIVYEITETAEDCDDAEAVAIQETYATCEDGVCWKITPCGGGADIKTYEDLAGLGYEVGDVLLLVDADDNRYCYTIVEEIAWDAGCVGLGTEEDPVGGKWLDPQKYEDCGDCNLTNKYKLENDCIHEDCEDGDPAADIVTNTDLHAAVGKYVKYRGICYKVSETADAVTKADLGEAPPAFADCEDCKAAAVDVTLEVLTKDGDSDPEWRTVKFTGVESVCPGGAAAEDCPE